MNILVIAPFGMYQSYTASFIHNQAKAYVKLGHRVRAVVPLAAAKRSNEGKRFDPPVKVVQKDGVEIYYVRYLSIGARGIHSFNPPSARLAVRLLSGRILKDFQPDVIHAHTIDFGSIVAQAFRERCPVPLVITTHGSDTNGALARGEEAQLKAVCDQAGAVVACSAVLAKNLCRCGTRTPVRYIYNGFAVEHVQSCSKIPGRITQVCSLVPSKHVEFTIQAVARLKERHPVLSLTVVGDGPERGRLENLTKELGLSDTVRFVGRLSNSDAMAEMAKAPFFIMPSFPEGLGIVYLEAMASGCVTVGTAGEGIDGLIVSGENGFLVPLEDVDGIVQVVDRCLHAPEEAAAIAERGRKTAMKLTWENNAAQYIALFQSLLN